MVPASARPPRPMALPGRRRRWRCRMRELARRYGIAMAAIFAGLTGFWLLALVVLPYISLAVQSFRPYLPVDQLGGPADVWTLANYQTFINASSTVDFLSLQIPIHVYIFLETVIFSSLVTVVTFALAYPL